MPGACGEGDQRGGDEGGKAASDDAGDLVTHAGAAVAVAGAEHFGEHRLLHANHHIMGDIGQHQREEQDPKIGLAFEGHKEREAAQGADQRAGNIDASTAKAIRQPGEARNGQAADPADEQADVEEQLPRQAEVLRGVVEGEGGNDIHRQQFAQA